MKFRKNQVVAVRPTEDKMYHWISDISKEKVHGSWIYFVDGDTSIKDKEGRYVAPYWIEFQLRKLNAREIGVKTSS